MIFKKRIRRKKVFVCGVCETAHYESIRNRLLKFSFNFILIVLALTGVFFLSLSFFNHDIIYNLGADFFTNSKSIYESDKLNSDYGGVGNNTLQTIIKTLNSFDVDNYIITPAMQYYFQDIEDVILEGGDCDIYSMLVTAIFLNKSLDASVDCNLDKNHCVSLVYTNEFYYVIDMTMEFSPVVSKYDRGVNHWYSESIWSVRT